MDHHPPILRRRLVLAATAAVLATSAGAGAARAATAEPDPQGAARAEAVLAAAGDAYRALPGLDDQLEIVLEAPGAEPETKTMLFRLGAGTDVYLAETFLTVIALGDRFLVTRADVSDKYLAVPYHGDFKAAAAAVFGEGGGMPELPQVALRAGKPLAAVLDACRFNLLPPLAVTGHQRARDDDGRPIDRVLLGADSGSVELTFDADSHLLTAALLSVQPPGAPASHRVKATVGFRPRPVDDPAGLVTFDAAGRLAVASFDDLDSKRLGHGEPLPAARLATLDGETVDLAALRGSVVVLDFWATWCVPCWATLHKLEDFARWAEGSGLPIAVYAVNVLENQTDPEAKREHVLRFWRSQDLTLTSLFDADDSFFHAVGSPGLPSMLVIDPQGRVVKHLVGESADTEAILRAEATALAGGGS